MPRLFPLGQNRIRMNVSKALLERFEQNERFITADKTWIYLYTPVMNEESKQWFAKGEPASKKTNTVQSAGKMMASIFEDNFVHRLSSKKVKP